MKKKIIIIIALILCLCIGSIYFISDKNKNTNTEINVSIDCILERKYSMIGNNLYYEEELMETKGQEDKDTILGYYENISKYIETYFPNTKFYIYNLNYSVENIYFNGYQIIDMVVIEDASFTLTINDNDIKGIYFGGHNFINKNIDTNNLINIEEAKKKALDLAKENYDKIFSFIDSSKKLKGEIYLSYDKEENLCYVITFNHGSYVKINAITGKVMESYFFNGIYY